MHDRSPLKQQVDTLPELLREIIDPLTRSFQQTLPKVLCQKLQRVFLTGCGDSFHAGLNAELVFEQLAGLPCEPMTAMQFGRYTASFLPDSDTDTILLLAVSVSGQVSRTAEALELGRKAGALAVAVTGNPDGALAEEADFVLNTAVPSLPDELRGLIVPSTRSYIASQTALYLTATHLGQQRQHLSQSQANKQHPYS